MAGVYAPIVDKLGYRDLSNLCRTNNFWRDLCERDDVWQNLYERDFGPNSQSRSGIPKQNEDEKEDEPLLFDWKTEYLLKISNRIVLFKNTSEERRNPFGYLPLTGLIGITQVAAADTTALFLDVWGVVHIIGTNIAPRLNLGMPAYTPQPVVFKGIPPIRKIAMTSYHYMFLDYEGRVWAVGRKKHGALGLGEVESTIIPKIIPELSEIVDIATSTYLSLYLDRSGRVFYSGKLGMGSNIPIPIPNIGPALRIFGNKPWILFPQDSSNLAELRSEPFLPEYYVGISDIERDQFIQTEGEYLIVGQNLYESRGRLTQVAEDRPLETLAEIYLGSNYGVLERMLEKGFLVDYIHITSADFALIRKDLPVTLEFVQTHARKLEQVGPNRYQDSRGYYFTLV